MDAETKSQIKSIWDDFWAGGLSNPLAVMEQITYLLFIKRPDELQTLEESKAATLKIPMERRIFPEGFDGRRTKKPGEPGYEPGYEDHTPTNTDDARAKRARVWPGPSLNCG